MQYASCAAQRSCWKILEIAAPGIAAAAFAAYSQLKRKFDTSAERVLPAGKFWKRWKNLGEMGNFGNWKELEMNKMHTFVNKNLTKMEFRRTTSKYKNKNFTTLKW